MAAQYPIPFAPCQSLVMVKDVPHNDVPHVAVPHKADEACGFSEIGARGSEVSKLTLTLAEIAGEPLV